MFHVEHSPIEKAPTRLRPAFKKLKRRGVDYLKGEGPSHRLPIFLRLILKAKQVPTPPRFAQSYTKAIGELRKNNGFVFAMSNQGVQLNAAKRPARRQQMNAFKQTGFT
jgi:hypothetical protein